MCGIAGFYNAETDFTDNRRFFEEKLTAMKNTLVRRGPNEDGTFLYPHAGLAHTRLSILDLAHGHQPMTKTINNHLCTIVYNGEIYNMHDLQKMLIKEGASFETECDTEVLLAGYLMHGTDFIKSCNGIFACALYDKTLDRLILVRDRLGVKPLFYLIKDHMLFFGSEPKAIFAYGIRPQLDQDGLCEIFALGPAKTYGKGIFKDMKEVLPGHFLVYEKGNLHEEPYWQLAGKEHTDSYEETVDKVSTLVYDAVKKQMLSDIPICTFLSGGVDSSLVSAICAKELKKEGKQLHTFSFDFIGNDQNFKANSFQPSQDRPYVDIMVKHIGSRHTYLQCGNTIQADYLYKAVDARDTPCMADVESSLLYFCEEVAKQEQVTLTGECADEIFGGYPWFHSKKAFETDNFPWSNDMAARLALLSDDQIKAIDFSGYAHAAYKKTISETPTFDGDTKEEARRREIAWLNIKWFMATLLDRMDRTSMYSGLEARVPLADHRILEYVYNIPWEMKCKDGIVKNLLRKAGEGILPHDVLYRKKSPYPKTYDPAYEKLLSDRLLEELSDPNAPLLSLIDKKKLSHFLSTPSDYGKPWYGQLMAGPQMLAYMLQINYWLKKYHVELI